MGGPPTAPALRYQQRHRESLALQRWPPRRRWNEGEFEASCVHLFGAHLAAAKRGACVNAAPFQIGASRVSGASAPLPAMACCRGRALATSAFARVVKSSRRKWRGAASASGNRRFWPAPKLPAIMFS